LRISIFHAKKIVKSWQQKINFRFRFHFRFSLILMFSRQIAGGFKESIQAWTERMSFIFILLLIFFSTDI